MFDRTGRRARTTGGGLLGLVLAGLVVGGTGPALAKQPKFDEKAYAAQVAKAESGAAGVDYRELRIQASARTDYAELNWADWQKADKLVDTDPAQALALARTRMAEVWTDFLPHIVAELAFTKLGKPDEAAREREITGAIVRSIGGGNRATSATDAFNAVSVAEEYRTLILLGWKPEGQSLVQKDGHTFDMFRVTDQKSGEMREVWFNIDVFFGKELGL